MARDRDVRRERVLGGAGLGRREWVHRLLRLLERALRLLVQQVLKLRKDLLGSR